MKTIINVPSDQEIYQVHVYYDIDTDTIDIDKYRVFAFEYMSTYHTYEGQVCGTETQFLSPISLAIMIDNERYEYSGIMDTDGKIRTYAENYDSLEDFKNFVKKSVIQDSKVKSQRIAKRL